MRALVRAVAALPLMLMDATPNWAQPVCRPTIAFTETHYASMKLPTLERTWTLAFTVDTSRCATSSGSFSILFTVWRENAPDTAYVETFQWIPDLNVISKEFWADEAVGAYTVNEIAPCPCSNYKNKSPSNSEGRSLVCAGDFDSLESFASRSSLSTALFAET